MSSSDDFGDVIVVSARVSVKIYGRLLEMAKRENLVLSNGRPNMSKVMRTIIALGLDVAEQSQ